MCNNFLNQEIVNQIMLCNNFLNLCKLSTLKDDNITDPEEQKKIIKITKITEKYIKELEKI